MAEYDLTAKLGRYFDRHLVFPLLEFLTERNVIDFSFPSFHQKKFSL
jgi:translation initiation factor 3 subunit E